MKNKSMKCPLNNRIKREFKSNLGRYIAISLMLIVFISILSGFLSVANGVKSSFDKNNIESKREDGQFSTEGILTSKQIEKIESTGIKIYDNFYLEKKLSANTTVRIYKSREKIDIETYVSGKKPQKSDEIALDRLFCKKNKIAIGDTITLDGKSYRVSGLLSMPDYSALFEKNSSLMMDAYHFGVGVVSDEDFEKDCDQGKYAITNNYSFLYNNQSMSKKQKVDLCKKLIIKINLENIRLNGFYPAEMNQSLSFVEDDMGSDVPMMKVMCYMILVIMAFVFSIVICSTIEEEAPIIGTLLANGYTRMELIRHYMTLPFLVTVVSAVLGNLLGYTIMPNAFLNMYYGSYSIIDAKFAIDIEALILTTLIPILMMNVINFMVLYKKLSISPLRFLRKDLKKRKNKAAVKLPDIAFIKRFRIRVILQNLSSYIILFIGLFLACFLLLFGICITPIMKNYIKSVENTAIADYQYVLNTPIETDDQIKHEKYVTTTLNTKYKYADKEYEITTYGIKGESQYIEGIDEQDLKKAEDGVYNVYVSDSLKNKIHLRMGDIFKVDDPFSQKTYRFRVCGTYKYSAGLCVFMNQEQLNEMLGNKQNYFNGYFSDGKLNIEDKFISLKMTTNDLTKVNKQVANTFKDIAPMCIVLALVIYLSLMYILTKLIIDKNTMSISYMKVFGYYEKEINRLYLRTTTIVLSFSLFIFIPLEYIGIKYVFDFALLKLNSYIPADIDAIYYLLIVVIGFVSYFLINTIQLKRVKNINMALALKNRE